MALPCSQSVWVIFSAIQTLKTCFAHNFWKHVCLRLQVSKTAVSSQTIWAETWCHRIWLSNTQQCQSEVYRRGWPHAENLWYDRWILSWWGGMKISVHYDCKVHKKTSKLVTSACFPGWIPAVTSKLKVQLLARCLANCVLYFLFIQKKAQVHSLQLSNHESCSISVVRGLQVRGKYSGRNPCNFICLSLSAAFHTQRIWHAGQCIIAYCFHRLIADSCSHALQNNLVGTVIESIWMAFIES